MKSRLADRRHVAGRRLSAAAVAEKLEPRALLSVTLVSAGRGGAIGAPAAGGATVSSAAASVSDDGRYVVFVADAANLTARDRNGEQDVFVRDVRAGTTTLVSAAPGGAAGNAVSGELAGGDVAGAGAVISGSGRYVVFASEASDLVAGDANGGVDLFLRDLQTGLTTLLTASAAGTGTGSNGSDASPETVWGRPAVSDDGRFVVFSSDADDLVAGQEDDGLRPDTFLRNTLTNTTVQLTRPLSGAGLAGGSGEGGSVAQSISGDGRYVAFVSADALVPGVTSGAEQAYLYDTTTNTTSLISVRAGDGGPSAGDARNPRLSAGGRHVVFQSNATDLVAGYARSPDLFASDNDLFHRDLTTGVTQLVSRQAGSATAGGSAPTGPGSVSGDGRHVAFYSGAEDLAAAGADANDQDDAFLFDAATGTVTPLSVSAAGDGSTVALGAGSVATDESPAVSEGGTVVVFASGSSALAADDPTPAGTPGLFVRPVNGGAARRLLGDQRLPGGLPAVAVATGPIVTPDGARVAFAAIGDVTSAGVAAAAGQQVYIDAPAADVVGAADPVLAAVASTLPPAVVGGNGQKLKVTVPVTVTNAGAGLLSGPVTVRLYASADDIVNGGDATVAAATAKLKLKPGQSRVVKVKVTGAPAVADGEYVLLAEVAGGAGVADADTTNNVAAADRRVTIAAPFVDLTAAAPVPPKAARPGKTTTLLLDVTNAGNVIAAGPTIVRLTLTPQGGGTPATVDVPAKLKIKPGATSRLKLKFVVPADLAAGAFDVRADLDVANAVVETNDANNAAGPVPLTVLA